MSNDGLFGVHGTALAVRSQRMGVLASNIANASTPGYKAKDIDFNAALASIDTQGGSVDNAIDANTLYRVPLQPSQDGNTVELATEQTAFAENAVAYQTTLAFLNGRIGFLEIARMVADTLERAAELINRPPATIEEAVALDAEARRVAEALIAGRSG